MSQAAFAVVIFLIPICYDVWRAHRERRMTNLLWSFCLGCAAVAFFGFCLYLGTIGPRLDQP